MDENRRLMLRRVGRIAAGAGLVIGLVSMLADVIGLSSDPDTFGYLQFTGAALGLVLLVVGVTLALYGNTRPTE